LEEEKAQQYGKVFNWETSKYGKIWYEDIHDLRSVETEFSVIAFSDEVSSKTLSYKPTVSSLNDEIDFKVSFNDSDDEDYMVIFDKNSFSYKKISTNDLKTDLENDNEKVMPSLPIPDPAVSCHDDLEIFKDFENEFPAIFYNDAPTSKSDLLIELILSPQHIDEFDLNNETSLSEYDEEEQNVLYFNDLLPFNIIHADDLKSEKDNDDNDIDIIQSSEDMAPLPPHDQRHLWLRYQVEGYTEEIVHDFEQRLETIFGRQVNRVHILDFERLTPNMRQDLVERMRMVYTGDDGQEMGGARCSMTWRQFILALGLHTTKEMTEDRFSAYWLGSERLIPDKRDLSDYWVKISSGIDFLRGAPLYTYIIDPVRRLCHILISYSISRRGQAPKKVTAIDLFYLRSMDRGADNILYLLAQYLFRHAKGRKSDARLSEGHFIRRLAHHFGLVSDDGLRGLSVVARELPLIDMVELVKLNICIEIGDDWAWVAPGPERQQVVAFGALEAAEDVPVVVEGGQVISAPVQAPQQPPPPPPPPVAARTMPQRLVNLEEEVQGLRRDVRSLRGLMERSMTDQGRFSTWMILYMVQLMDASGLTCQAFDGTFQGSSTVAFQRRTM
ncbi:hypothetical protein Tco_0622916, partial [Tanacetum coccineum]